MADTSLPPTLSGGTFAASRFRCSQSYLLQDGLAQDTPVERYLWQGAWT